MGCYISLISLELFRSLLSADTWDKLCRLTILIKVIKCVSGLSRDSATRLAFVADICDGLFLAAVIVLAFVSDFEAVVV